MGKGKLLRKGLAMLLAIVMIIGFLPGVGSLEVSAEETGTSGANSIKLIEPKGDGTADNPYQIGTKEELYWFAYHVNSGKKKVCAELTADIIVNTGVLNEEGDLVKDTSKFINWTPIGSGIYSFEGIFNGQNHTISGLYFDEKETRHVGLFACLNNEGSILNVGVLDSYFNGMERVGGVCGMTDGGTITNCYNAGRISGKNMIGGICGESMYEMQMKNCYNTGEISGESFVGGMCGSIALGTITNCYNMGRVSGTGSVGGVCAYSTQGTITNCYSIGEVSGPGGVGGVCGYLTDNSTITNCYFDKNACSSEDAVAFQSESNVENVSGKTTEEMHKADFCDLITYESYQNGICILCSAYQEADRTENKYDINKDDNYEVVYEIGNAGQLYWFANFINSSLSNTSANAVLTKDITVNTGVLNEEGNLVKDTSKFIKWTPIGTGSYLFKGTFDGQNHTISGLYFDNGVTDGVGLFGYVGDGGSLVNVGVVDSYFNGDNMVGSICGFNDNGIIENCYHTGNVNGMGEYVGGVCGYNNNVIQNCYNTGNVNGSSGNVGGVCGWNNNAGEVQNCYNTGDVNGASGTAGGVCGRNNNVIQNCYNTGDVNGTSDTVGGVCGRNSNVIQNCYNTGVVKGSSFVGGVCGDNTNGTIENCYNTGDVNGKMYCGGVCGNNAYGVSIKNCYYNAKDKGLGASGGTETKVEGKTTEQFQSGEVAYLLQEDQTELVWGQKLTGENKQDSPVLDGDRVYKVNRYLGCKNALGNPTDAYSNLDEEIFESHKDDGSQGGTAYDNRCDFCGKEIHSFKEDGSCKDAGCVYHKGIITNVNYKTNIVYSGDVGNAEPKAGDFTVNSGQALTFKWYQGDVTTGDLPKDSLGAAPKEAGIYTLVVNAAGVEKDGIIYTIAELRVKVTIEKEPVKEQPTTPKPSDTTTTQQPNTTTTTQQPSSTTEVQPPKNGDVITDDKTKAKFEVTDVTKKEVIYNAPTDEKAKDITVPDTVTINGEVYKVTKIADNAFKGNKTVTSITIGSNVKTIGKNAFSGCKKLKTIVIKSKTLTDKKISKKAFKGISKKVAIKVPKKKLAAYKKFLKKKGLSSKNKVKGY